MDDQPAPQTDDAPPPRGSPLVLAVVASLLAHALFGAAVKLATAEDDPPAAISLVDIEVAPQAPEAEVLGPEIAKAQPPEPDPDPIEQPPEPPPEPPPVTEDFVVDAGVPIDAAPPKPEPTDARPAVAESTKVQAGEDAGLVATTEPTDGGVPSDATILDTPPASAATAANLLAHFPSKHMVSVVLRFDRLRGTEWSPILQEVMSAMPDFKTLIADPKTVVADRFDLVAMSSARWKDASATILAVKSPMAPADLRDFLDEPGAPVTWSRVTGGVLGTRGAGDRVRKGDTRLFLSPFPSWTVLAKPKDLKGAMDPADGDLDTATADAAKLPAWLAHVPELEAESGVPDGPAVLVTLAPKSKRWELPSIGLAIEDLPAPERLTLTAEIDPQGFKIRGNLKFRSVEDAAEFVKSIEAARAEVLDSALMSGILEKMRAMNAIKGLDLGLVTGDDRVSYSTSISIADARKLFAFGASMVVDYFAELTEAAEAPEPDPKP